MSLIADALKAAQEAKTGPAGSSLHTAAARRILAPAVRTGGAGRAMRIPRQLQVALAVFGVALATAAAVVVASPGPSGEELPGSLDFAGNAMLPLDGTGAPGVAAADGAPEDDSRVPAAMVTETEAAGESGARAPAATAGGSGAAGGTATQPRPADRSGTADPQTESSRTGGEVGVYGGDSGMATPRIAAPEEPSAPPPRTEAASRQGSFELRLGDPRRGSGQWFTDALSAQRRRDYGAAIQMYQRALQEDPENVEALNNLGTVHQSSGDLAAAREAFRRAITIQPAYASAWSNLGMVLGAMGEHSQSQAALAEAIRLDPGNHGARVNLALQYQKQGLRAEARRLLEQVVQSSPAMAEAHYALGRLLEEEGDRAGAVRHYRLFLTTGAGRFPALEAAVQQRVDQLGG